MSFIKNFIKNTFQWQLDAVNTDIFNGEKTYIRINPLTLKLPDNLESSFLNNYYNGSILQINISAVLGAIIIASFSFLDWYLVPELFYEYLALRIGLGWLIIGIALFLLNRSSNKSFSQPILSLAVILIASILVLAIILAAPKLNSYYFIGIILLNFWAFTFLRLRFFWASFTGTAIFLTYLLSSIFIVGLDLQILIISSSHIFASTVAGIAISYLLEYHSRKDFLNTILLNNSLQQNLTLSARIHESDRTIGLVEERLMLQSKALEAAANSIIIMNKEGKIIWCNEAFLNLTGYKLEEVFGKNPRILKSGQHDEFFYKNIWSTILSGRVWSGEIVNRKKSGELYYEEMIITPVLGGDNNKISHFIAIKQDITNRKEMENRLHESEKRLRNFVDNATVGIYRTTPDGEIVMANDALMKMLGFDSVDDLKQRNLTMAGYVNAEQREIFQRILEKNGSLVGFESEWRKKDGSIIHIRESARLSNEDGNIIFEGTVEDISISKFAEKQLRESKERLQSIFDNVYHAIFIHDISGRVIDVNKKVLELYKITQKEALQITIKDISRDDMPFDKVQRQWQKVVSEGKSFLFEWKALRPNDGSVFDVEVFLSKIVLGEETYILANVRDITKEKEAYRKLLITQEAVNFNATPIFWLNKDSKFIYANNAAVAHLGYSIDELLNLDITEIDPDWLSKFNSDNNNTSKNENGIRNFETIHENKNGKLVPVEVNATLINFEDEEVIIADISDITQRKIAADALVLAKEKAEQSDRLKSEFLAGMSHEIRTPVNTILNFISLIKADLGENITDDIAESFQMIDSGSRRLIRTIDSIINMSQLQAGAYEINSEMINIEELLQKLICEFKNAAASKNLKLSLETKVDAVSVYADQYTLTQLFVNLIDNAIKYTNKGGVSVVIFSEEEQLKVIIKDTGIGISDEFLPILFEPFIQEEMGYTRSFEGNGLGLALVKKYADLNNFQIEVESKKNEGSVFTVCIPMPVVCSDKSFRETKVALEN